MPAEKNKPNELYIERIFDAPVKMVWDAWTEPNQVAQWWGPRGFTITTKSKDVKTGGTWDYIMHGPDGKDWPNFTQYLEVTPYKRMVYDHGGNSEQKPMFRVTVNFLELANNKTKMEMWMALPSEEAAKATKQYIKQAGGNSTWDRLAEYLGMEKDHKDIFVINHTFNTSLNTMWEMWTTPKHFAQWMGPTGSSMDFIRAEINPGGTSFYKMVNGDGSVMFGKIKYHELSKPNRLVYSQFFVDEKEKISRHPMAPTWPESMLTTVLFEAESENQTRVTITWEIDSAATEIERETFNKAKAGMSGGWGGSFDKLENYLGKL